MMDLPNTPETRAAVQYIGKQAFESGQPISAVPEYGYEQLRACWRIGWRRAQAKAGVVSPAPSPCVSEKSSVFPPRPVAWKREHRGLNNYWETWHYAKTDADVYIDALESALGLSNKGGDAGR